MSKRGKLIVFEGIDGAGTETQSKLLLKYFKSRGIPAKRVSYPGYAGPIGRFIKEYQDMKHELSLESQVLIYVADMVKDVHALRKLLDKGITIIADRYITATMAYQGFRGFPPEKIINLAEIFSMPVPDNIIYLRISPETSLKRKRKEKKDMDRNEKDKKLLDGVGKFYLKLASIGIFGKWDVIDGEQSIEKVSFDVRNVLGLK